MTNFKLSRAAVKVFRLDELKLQIINGLRILFRNSVDHVVEYGIAAKLKQVLSVGRIAYICNLIEGNTRHAISTLASLVNE